MNDEAEAQARFEQRVLDIPGVELIATYDPADHVLPAPKTDPPPRGWLFTKWWMTCTPSDDPVEARAYFIEKYDRHPEYVFEQDGMLWLGPL